MGWLGETGEVKLGAGFRIRSAAGDDRSAFRSEPGLAVGVVGQRSGRDGEVGVPPGQQGGQRLSTHDRERTSSKVTRQVSSVVVATASAESHMPFHGPRPGSSNVEWILWAWM